MRLFIAVDVPPVSLREMPGTSASETSHITLKFLGEVERSRIRDIGTALEIALAGANGGGITLQGLGAFPRNDDPRVLWVGVTGGSEMICALHDRVEKAMEGLGFPKENRPFHPHVTLARPKGPDLRESAREVIRSYKGKVLAVGNVDSVVLKESELTEHGALHTSLLRIPLSQPPS